MLYTRPLNTIGEDGKIDLEVPIGLANYTCPYYARAPTKFTAKSLLEMAQKWKNNRQCLISVKNKYKEEPKQARRPRHKSLAPQPAVKSQFIPSSSLSHCTILVTRKETKSKVLMRVSDFQVIDGNNKSAHTTFQKHLCTEAKKFRNKTFLGQTFLMECSRIGQYDRTEGSVSRRRRFFLYSSSTDVISATLIKSEIPGFTFADEKGDEVLRTCFLVFRFYRRSRYFPLLLVLRSLLAASSVPSSSRHS